MTLLVVVDPPGVVPIFVALTKDEQPARRRKILIRAVLIAFGVALFFLLAGRAVLSYLGVTVHAFAISGGVLLFATAMPMLFGQRGGLQSPDGSERGSMGHDISVFPLAIPMLSGPGVIATILLLTSQVDSDPRRLVAVAAATALVFLVTFVSLYLGARLIALLGEGGVHIATRVMGIVLAALCPVRFKRHHRLLLFAHISLKSKRCQMVLKGSVLDPRFSYDVLNQAEAGHQSNDVS